MSRSDPAYPKSSALQDVGYIPRGPTSCPAVAAPCHGSELGAVEGEEDGVAARPPWTELDSPPPLDLHGPSSSSQLADPLADQITEPQRLA
jgi:hypothetical protein